MSSDEKTTYLEFPAKDLALTKEFFTTVFNWEFKDFGSEYTTFWNESIKGGFYRSNLNSTVSNGGVLVVLYTEDLEAVLKQVEVAKGTIVKPIFSFPGGRRFHFSDPNGNELAVWSDS